MASKPAPLTIVIDTREQRPLDFSPAVATVRATLKTGDYSVLGLEDRVCIERKSLDDLAGTIIEKFRDENEGRENRFLRELARMRAYEYASIMVEGTWSDVMEKKYKSEVHPHSIIGALMSFKIKFGVPAILSGSRTMSAHLIETQLRLFAKYAVGVAQSVPAIAPDKPKQDVI